MKNILFTLALLISFVSFGQTAEEYFNSGREKDEAKDYYGAIADYTKAIEINPNYFLAYYSRGIIKYNQKDDLGAIADFTEAIELEPNNGLGYLRRGTSKFYLNDMDGACQDARKAKELGTDASQIIEAACK